MAKNEFEVIYCTNPVHAQTENANGKPVKKILLILKEFPPNSKIYTQCRDSVCRKTGKSNGWYEVSCNEVGGVTVRPCPTGFRFDTQEMPVAVAEQPTKLE